MILAKSLLFLQVLTATNSSMDRLFFWWFLPASGRGNFVQERNSRLGYFFFGQDKLVVISLNGLFRPLYAIFVEENGGKMKGICDDRARGGKEKCGERKEKEMMLENCKKK